MNQEIENLKKELIDTVHNGLKEARKLGTIEGIAIGISVTIIVVQILNLIVYGCRN